MPKAKKTARGKLGKKMKDAIEGLLAMNLLL